MPRAETDEGELLLTWPILTLMRKIEGWLEDDEADLLIAAAARALAAHPEAPAIVEVGSYCGRSTVVLGSVVRAVAPSARVYAIDPHDGKVGALDQGVEQGAPTLERFRRNIAEAGLGGVVETVKKYSYEVSMEREICLLLIDGLHDYANVARDFYQFEPRVVAGGLIAFHDYAHYYPGVQAFVNEILDSGGYRRVCCARSMMVVQKLPAA
jgi:predicted O-methyltransferase YrrM